MKSPLAMDIYLWLVYRLNAISVSTLVTWENLRQQFGQGFANDKHGRYRFKNAFMNALPLAHIHYPEAKIMPVKAGLLLKESRSNVVS